VCVTMRDRGGDWPKCWKEWTKIEPLPLSRALPRLSVCLSVCLSVSLSLCLPHPTCPHKLTWGGEPWGRSATPVGGNAWGLSGGEGT
jgi:hypothetical protein